MRPWALAIALATAGGLVAAPPRATGAGGGLLVFERSLAGNSDLYAVPLAGGVERRLTDHPAEDILPRFTPDGREVVFSSKRTGEWQIFEVSVAGGEPRRLRSNRHREWQADPSPDGRLLAFLSNRDGGEALYVQARAGGEPRRLVGHGGRSALGNPSWSPDGRRIAYSSNHGLPGHRTYVVGLATGEQRRVSPLAAGACEPRFGRDGRRLAYVRRSHATRDRSQIVEVDLDGGGERVLVDWPALNYDPVYSPDGSELAFASTVAGEFAIYRMRLADGEARRVTHGPGAARHPDYRP